MTMRKKQMVGTKYLPALDHQVDANQTDLLNEIITPHSTRLNEILGPCHQIVSKVAAYNVEAQPTQARGRIVWNKAYEFQPHGPSYLDPIPDPGLVGGY